MPVASIVSKLRALQRPRPATLAVLAVALVARVLYWRYATGGYRPQSDAFHYFEIAKNVATGDGFSYVFPQLEEHATAFRPPLFPGLLGGLFWVFGASVTVGRLLNLVVGLAAVATGMRLAEVLGAGFRGRVVAGLALALWPPLIFNDVVLLTESLSILLLLGTLVLLGTGRIGFAAVAAGLLALSRSSAQFVAIVFAAWVLWQFGWRTALRFLVTAVLVMLPWAVRNAVQLDAFTLSTSTGFNLAAIYGPPAIDAGVFVDPIHDPYYDDIRILQFDEAAWERELRKIALESLRDRPSAVWQVLGRNSQMFFELRPSFNQRPESIDGRNLDVRNAFSWLAPVLAVAGTVGLWRLRRRSPLAALMAGLSLYFIVLSLFTIAVPRLRAPVDAMWCVALVGLLPARALDRAADRDEHAVRG